MNNDQIMEALAARAMRREGRREFIKAASVSAVAVTALGACGSNNNDFNPPVPPPPPVVVAPPPPPPPPPAVVIGDPEILNFALNLEYLEAEFYSYAVFGTGLPADLRTGSGTQGMVTEGRKVAFTDPVVAQYAQEIAEDEIAHVRFLRTALGANGRVSEPAIDVGVGPNNAFSQFARGAGLIGPGDTFNPYANDDAFLLGAFIFEDVGVTAYKGASPLITSPAFLTAAAGILAAEAYHAGLVRTILYRRGVTGDIRYRTESISAFRDALDTSGDSDQGVIGTADASNIVPADANGLAFSRTAGQVLNIVYANSSVATMGGFFPAGVNGVIRSSTGVTRAA